MSVSVETLANGDYLFDDLVVFELKTIDDFISSVKSGRVFNQALEQSKRFPYNFVVVFGTQKELKRILVIYNNKNVKFNYYQYLGAIASLNTFTTVLEINTPHIKEVYYRMLDQARKCIENKYPVKMVSKKDDNPCFNWLCFCINGVSSKKADLIVNTLDLQNLEDLLSITVDDLQGIKGIGKKTAEKIMETLQ